MALLGRQRGFLARAARTRLRSCCASAVGMRRPASASALRRRPPARRASVRRRAAAARPCAEPSCGLGHRFAQRRASTPRISLPTYCIWRRRPSWERVRWYSRDRVAQRLGHVQRGQARRRAARPAPRRAPAARAPASSAAVLLGRSRVVGVRRCIGEQGSGHARAASVESAEAARYDSAPLAHDQTQAHDVPSQRHSRLCLHRASSSSRSSKTRWRCAQAARRQRCRRRGVGRRGPVGVGAQGRARERRAQPRQVARRHGLHRPAPRQCQHLGLLARRRSSRRCAPPTTSRASPPRTRPPACPTTPTWPPRDEAARDLDLFHPWAIDAAGAAAARAALRGGGAVDRPRASPTPKAPACRRSSRTSWSGNTRGFRGGYASSRHSLSVAPIAGHAASGMQRDCWYSSMRDARELAAPEAVGRYAAERALSRLESRKIATCEVPVLFESPLAAGLLGAYVQATSGGALYRKASFLLDSLGKPVLADAPRHRRRPAPAARARAARRSTTKACARARARVVEAGVVQGYFLSSYSARKLGMRTTGHAGGSQNLTLTQPPHAARRRPRRDAAQAAPRPVRDRADGPGRELRDRRLLARRRGLLGRERPDRATRCRRSPSPATCATC